MNKLIRLVRTTIPIICGAYLVALALHFVMQTSAISDRTPLDIGMEVQFGTGGAKHSILMAVSESCPYSRQNQAFHKAVIKLAQEQRVPITLLAARADLVPGELRDSLGPEDRLVIADFPTLRIGGTPTLLNIVDGRIANSWVGMMNKSQQDAALSRIGGQFETLTRIDDSPSEDPQDVRRVSSSDLASFLTNYQVVDISERSLFLGGHRASAVNIPADELSARMAVELKHSHIVLDCTKADMGKCMGEGKLLHWAHFDDVWVLNSGAVGASCFTTRVK